MSKRYYKIKSFEELHRENMYTSVFNLCIDIANKNNYSVVICTNSKNTSSNILNRFLSESIINKLYKTSIKYQGINLYQSSTLSIDKKQIKAPAVYFLLFPSEKLLEKIENKNDDKKIIIILSELLDSEHIQEWIKVKNAKELIESKC